MRTNIVLDDELVKLAMELSGLKTKKAVVEESLKAFVRLQKQRSLKDSFGKFPGWEGDIDAMRRDK